MKHFKLKNLALLLLASVCTGAFAATPATVRVDYFHGGNADSEMFSLHQVVIEPLPWPGNPGKPIDTVGLGHFLFQVETNIPFTFRDGTTEALGFVVNPLVYSYGLPLLFGFVLPALQLLQWSLFTAEDALDSSFAGLALSPSITSPSKT